MILAVFAFYSSIKELVKCYYIIQRSNIPQMSTGIDVNPMNFAKVNE